MLKVGFTIAGVIISALIVLYIYSWLFVDVRPYWCKITITCLWCALAILQFLSAFGESGWGSDGLD